MGSMSLLYRSSRFLVQSVRRQSRSHSCSSFSFLDKVVQSSLLCNYSAVWFRRQKTVQVRSCSLNVVDAPVTQVLRGAAGAVPAVMDVPVIIQRRWFAAALVGKALCTGTGSGLPPAIRAEKGWRGRRESYSQVTCQPIHCMLLVCLVCLDKHTCQAPRPHHHHHHHHTPHTTHHTPHHSTHHTPPPPEHVCSRVDTAVVDPGSLVSGGWPHG